MFRCCLFGSFYLVIASQFSLGNDLLSNCHFCVVKWNYLSFCSRLDLVTQSCPNQEFYLPGQSDRSWVREMCKGTGE